MNFDYLFDEFQYPKKRETKYFVTEKRGMWIVEDSEDRSAIGKTFEEAKENFIAALNKEYLALKEKVDREAAENRRKHRELWGY